MDKIRIGTRKSQLAVKQTSLVIEKLLQHYPALEHEIVPIQTKGDQVHHKPLRELGDEGKTAFTSELEKALEANKIDIAVHSMKDVAGNIRQQNLTFRAFLKRGSAEDVLITKENYSSIEELPKDFVVGTVSLRRRAALLRMNPELQVKNLRGNVQTRIAKLNGEHEWQGHKKLEYDGIIMAKAALERCDRSLDISGLNVIEIPIEKMIPAAGQGVIGVQCRKNDDEILNKLSAINDIDTEKVLRVERDFLYELSGNCHTVIGVHARLIAGDNIKLVAEISEENGENRFYIENISHSKELGVESAKELRKRIANQKGVEFMIKNLNLSLR